MKYDVPQWQGTLTPEPPSLIVPGHLVTPAHSPRLCLLSPAPVTQNSQGTWVEVRTADEWPCYMRWFVFNQEEENKWEHSDAEDSSGHGSWNSNADWKLINQDWMLVRRYSRPARYRRREMCPINQRGYERDNWATHNLNWMMKTDTKIIRNPAPWIIIDQQELCGFKTWELSESYQIKYLPIIWKHLYSAR